MLMRRATIVVIGIALSLGLVLHAAAARADVRIIRDAEVEAVIAGYAAPLFAAGGLDPAAVHVYVIEDDSINAFVAGGMNLFVFTGLLLRAESPNQIAAVIAHETGHIIGGHLARSREAVRNASIEAIVACLLGTGTAIGTGEASAAAVCQLGRDMGVGYLMGYSRAQEAAADQAGLSLLAATGQSPRGTLEFLKILERQEAIQFGPRDPYLRSHPLTRERINAAAFNLARSAYANKTDSPQAMAQFRRMQAKLRGYSEPKWLQSHFRADDQSLEARYARAIAAHYRLGRPDEALTLVDGLIAEHPNDPYFQELKGEILLTKGDATAALPFYERALAALPDAALLRIGHGRALFETGDSSLLPAAIGELEMAARAEPRSPDAWHWLAMVYGADGQIGRMSLALAEEAATRAHPAARRRAREQAQRAMSLLPKGSPPWLRAQDIAIQMDDAEDSGGLQLQLSTLPDGPSPSRASW